MKRHALLIGVERYQDERITPLRYAAADARDLGLALRDRCGFEHVTVLAGAGTDGEPTLSKVLDELRRLTHQVRADDLFFFGFSGHGVEDPSRNEGYLFAADSRADHPSLISLPLGTLKELLGRMEARWQVLLLDACRNNPMAGKGDAGSLMGDAFARNLVSVAMTGGGPARVTALLSACRKGQRAHEWPDFGHGVCSHFVLEGLRGEAWNGGRLTMRGLAEHNERSLKRWCTRSGLQQQPWFEQYGTADILLGEDTAALVPADAEARAKQRQADADKVIPLPKPATATPTKERPFENSLGMKFVPVPVSHDGLQTFLFCIWPTRVQDYEAYSRGRSGVNGEWQHLNFEQEPEHPVVNVSWEDAKDFCEWLTRKEQSAGKIEKGQRYRLPADLEWSSAVGIERYPWGEEWPPKRGAENYRGAGNYSPTLMTDNFLNTSPVGSFEPNTFGLFDLGGNVWEICGDLGPEGRVLARGSSHKDADKEKLRSSKRLELYPNERSNQVGFRIILAPDVPLES